MQAGGAMPRSRSSRSASNQNLGVLTGNGEAVTGLMMQEIVLAQRKQLKKSVPEKVWRRIYSPLYKKKKNG